MNDTTKAVERGTRENRARGWIETLTALPERCAGTASERAAAEHTGRWMHEMGLPDVRTEPASVRPRAGFSAAVHIFLAAIGCWWGGFLGTVLALVALYSFRVESRHHRPVLSRLLMPPMSLNVVGRLARENPARRVILSAHIDAAQAGWIFSSRLADLYSRVVNRTRVPNQPPPGPLALPDALLVAAALVTAASWLGAHGFVFGLLRALTILGLLTIGAIALQWALSRATPGANDNASAVAAMLTCAERLLPHLPADVELWAVGTGAEEVGCDGMHAFVEQHRDWPLSSTFCINFECVGGGTLHYVRTEGMLDKVAYPPMLMDLARRVAASGAFGAVTATDLLAATDGVVPAALGYPSLSIISLEGNGVPRNYHLAQDTVDRLDMATVVRAADFGAAVATAALLGEAGPVVPL